MRNTKKSSNYSQDTRKLRKILNEEVRLGIHANSESDTEEVDLSKDLYPLSHYINNREEMIEQMFSIIKGAKLKKMLPTELKDLPSDEIKADCLIHLLGMSSKRILAILEGREINSSSDSETHSDSSASPSKKVKITPKPIIVKQEGCSDISDNSEEIVLVNPDCRKRSKKGHRAKHKKNHGDEPGGNDKSENSNIVTETSNPKHRIEVVENASLLEISSDEENCGKPAPPTGGTNLLEILELEMRARAIRALLQNSGTSEGGESEHIEDQPSQSIIDQADKQTKPSNEGIKRGNEKVTPAKNFRKKKRKNDDVIMITPKVFTIDLTDENDQNCTKNKVDTELPNKSSKHHNIEENVDLSQIKSTNENNGCNNVVTEAVTKIDLSKKNSKQNILEAQCNSDQSRNSWAQRWLESKEVKKVVSTSKICGNIRKRIKSAKLAKKSQENMVNISTEHTQIQGSVNEYQLLSKTNTGNVNSTEANTVPVCAEEGMPVLGSVSNWLAVEQVQDISSTKSETISENILDEFAEKNEKEIGNNANNSCTDSLDENNESGKLQTGLENTAKAKSILKPRSEIYSSIVDFNPESEGVNFCHALSNKADEKKYHFEKLNDTSMNNEMLGTCPSRLLLYMKKMQSSENNTLLGVKECEPVEQSLIKRLKPDECQDFSEKHDLNYALPHKTDHQREDTYALDKVKTTTMQVYETAEIQNKTSTRVSPPHENEPETLEINITDEDRDIDIV